MFDINSFFAYLRRNWIQRNYIDINPCQRLTADHLVWRSHLGRGELPEAHPRPHDDFKSFLERKIKAQLLADWTTNLHLPHAVHYLSHYQIHAWWTVIAGVSSGAGDNASDTVWNRRRALDWMLKYGDVSARILVLI